MSGLVITIMVDSPDSWIMPYVNKLINELKARNHTVHFVQHHSEIKPGDIAFFLSCRNIVPSKTLSLNKHNMKKTWQKNWHNGRSLQHMLLPSHWITADRPMTSSGDSKASKKQTPKKS